MSLSYKKIPVGVDHFALVDPYDFGFVSRFIWHYHNGYARNLRLGLMHRFILGLPKNAKMVDHSNGNKLDNRKGNLRLCSYGQNMRNRKSETQARSGYKGVFQRKQRTGGLAYRAYIRVEGKSLNLGTFATPENAALAYNEAAKKYFGEFACFNKIPSVGSKASKSPALKRDL